MASRQRRGSVSWSWGERSDYGFTVGETVYVERSDRREAASDGAVAHEVTYIVASTYGTLASLIVQRRQSAGCRPSPCPANARTRDHQLRLTRFDHHWQDNWKLRWSRSTRDPGYRSLSSRAPPKSRRSARTTRTTAAPFGQAQLPSHQVGERVALVRSLVVPRSPKLTRRPPFDQLRSVRGWTPNRQ